VAVPWNALSATMLGFNEIRIPNSEGTARVVVPWDALSARAAELICQQNRTLFEIKTALLDEFNP
jgi:hypothetical protein